MIDVPRSQKGFSQEKSPYYLDLFNRYSSVTIPMSLSVSKTLKKTRSADIIVRHAIEFHPDCQQNPWEDEIC